MGKTLNEYFYKPVLGASGGVEMGKFHDCLDVADAEIKANKDKRHTQGTDYTNVVICANYDNPDNAITAIGANNKTLLVTEVEICDVNFTVPANVCVKFERGGKWTINGEYFGSTVFTGTGLNDATIGGTYTGTTDLTYKIQIDGKNGIKTSTLGVGGTGYAVNDTFTVNTGSVLATGKVLTVNVGVVLTYSILTSGSGYTVANGVATTATLGTGTGLTINITVLHDTFKWSDDGGATWDATGVAITGAAQTLNNGVTVTFGAIVGHTLTDYWTVTAYHAIIVTFNGQIDAGLWQIFAYVGTGVVHLHSGSIKEIIPQWWGAKGDGITDDTAAVQYAINVIGTNHNELSKILCVGQYKIAIGGLSIPASYNNVTFEGAIRSTIYTTKSGFVGTAGGTIFTLGNSVDNFSLRNLGISEVAVGIYIPIGSLISNLTLVDVSFTSITDKAIYNADTSQGSGGIIAGSLTRCSFYDVKYGLYSIRNAVLNNFHIRDCYFANPKDAGYQIYIDGLDNVLYNTNISINNTLINGKVTTTSKAIYLGGGAQIINLEDIHFADWGLTAGTNDGLELITIYSGALNLSQLAIKGCNFASSRGEIINISSGGIGSLILEGNSFVASKAGEKIIENANLITNLVSIGNRYNSDTPMLAPTNRMWLNDTITNTPLPSGDTSVNLPITGTIATNLNKLSNFAATTSAELAGVISDEIGAGKLRFDTAVTAKISTATLTVAQAGTILVKSNIVTGTDIAFVDGGAGEDTITSVANAFGGYAVGDSITITGAANAGNNSTFTITGAAAGTLTVATASLTAEAAGASVTIKNVYTLTLPTAVGHSGLRYHFIKTDANYNLITLDGNGTETLNYENSTGAPTLTYARLNTYCAEVTIVSDGANWQVINEGLGQIPECRAYLGTDQLDITDSTWVLIIINTENYDIGNNFDTSTYKFVAPIPGTYLMFGQIKWKDLTVIADKKYELGFFVNNAQKTSQLMHSSITGEIVNFSQLEITLAISDYITLKGVAYAGVSTVDISGGSSATWISVKLVSKT